MPPASAPAPFAASPVCGRPGFGWGGVNLLWIYFHILSRILEICLLRRKSFMFVVYKLWSCIWADFVLVLCTAFGSRDQEHAGTQRFPNLCRTLRYQYGIRISVKHKKQCATSNMYMCICIYIYIYCICEYRTASYLFGYTHKGR